MSSLPFYFASCVLPNSQEPAKMRICVWRHPARPLCLPCKPQRALLRCTQPLSRHPDLSSTSCRLRKRRRHAASRHTCVLLHTAPVHPRTRRTSKRSCGGNDAQQRVCGSSRGAAGIPSGVNHTGRVGGAEHSQLNQRPSGLIWMQLSALLLLRTTSPPPWALNSCFATLSAAA